MQNNISLSDSVVAKLNSAYGLFNSLREVSGYMRNWYELAFIWTGTKSNVVAILADGSNYKIEGAHGYYIFRNCVFVPWYMKSHTGIKSKISSNVMTLSVKEKRLKFYYKNKMQLSNAFSILYEIFVKEQYGQLDVKNKQVVDIGASLGDAAMYFSIKGARHVYSFELYPSLYDFGIKNVKANNLRNITLLNEGCGAKESTIEIDKKQESTIFGSVRKTHYGKKVKITTLRDIVNKYKIEDAALKIDCEGCEYGIILESKIETLRKFDNMIIEYHKGYKNLIDKLESAGFECKKTLPKELKDSATKIFYIGFIYAKRKDNWGHG